MGTSRRREQSSEVAADLFDDFEAHLAGGAGDDSESGFIIPRVEVFALRVHDVHHLFARDFTDFRFVRFL